MLPAAEDPVAANGAAGRRVTIPSTLWLGWAASVLVVLLATVAVEVTPHPRGVSFFTELRYAIVAPLCVLATIAAAFGYRALDQRNGRPRWKLAMVLFGAAAIFLIGMASFGRPGLARAAWPMLLIAAGAMAWLVPRFVDRPRRSRVGTTATAACGVLEILGIAGALSSERAASTGPSAEPGPCSAELAFEIPRSMFDVEHKYLDLPGGARVHYVDEGGGNGTAETLLFLHGNPSWSFQWRGLIHGLRDSHRCVALDYPGFGLSKAPERFGFTPREESIVVEEFVDRLGLRDLTLVMQDWGGPIGIGLAERRPELVRRVVLGSTWAWRTSPGEPRGIFSRIVGGPVGEFAQMNFNGFARFGIRHGIVRELPPAEFAMYVRPFVRVERRGVAAFYPGQITAAVDTFVELEAGLAKLRDKPALIFWALQDAGFPRGDLERWQDVFPNHKTIELPEANHFFFEDAVDQMIPEIRAFTSELEANTAPVRPSREERDDADR